MSEGRVGEASPSPLNCVGLEEFCNTGLGNEFPEVNL